MSNLTLERFDKDGIEILIDTQTGESYATAKGYSRMSGKDYDTIKKRCRRGGLSAAEVPTEQGLRWGTLIPEDLIVEWLPKDNPEMATKLMRVGVRTFMHELAGYKVISTAVFDPSSLTKLDILRMAVESEENYLAEIEKNKALTNIIEEQAPLVKLAETLTTKEVDTVSIGDTARAYGIGRTTFFNLLRDINFIQQKPSRQPYQHHIDAGRAEVYRKERAQQPGMFDNVTVLTTKGQEYIARKLAELNHYQLTEVAMEAVVALHG